MYTKEEDIGNHCVRCNRDTSLGSGLFVNRIPTHCDSESWFEGKKIFEKNHYRIGYLCLDCSAIECDRCNEMISIEEYIKASDFTWDVDKSVYSKILHKNQHCFKDGAIVVHYECLKQNEQKIYDEV
tara:strand:- start:40423 stop:40803 length:381 start_codon:yes stop_codon:yes gene_type:complete